MSWAEVIKINSDMTVSLDELIKSAKTELIDLINSQRSLGASDSVMKVISSTEVKVNSDERTKEIGRFTCNKNGSVRIKWDMQAHSGGSYTAVVRFYVTDLSGGIIFEESISSSETQNWVNRSKDISVKSDTTYIIYGELKSTNGDGYFNNVNVCATVIDASFIS